MRKFADLLLAQYIKTDPNTGVDRIHVKLSAFVVLMKVGQVQKCYARVYSIQDKFKEEYQNTHNLGNKVRNSRGRQTSNESNLSYALKGVYDNISDLVAVRFCNKDDYKIQTWPGVCAALN